MEKLDSWLETVVYQKIEKAIYLFLFLVDPALFIVCLFLGFFSAYFWFIFCGVLGFVEFFIIKKGFKRVTQEERLLIETFGRYDGVKGPGLVFVLPFIQKVRACLLLWEFPIDLFPENPRIDFKDGGTAELIDPKVWLKIKGEDEKEKEESMVKMVYNVQNFELAVRELIENALRSYLNSLTIEEVIEKRRAQESGSSLWWANVRQFYKNKQKENELVETLENWGLEVVRITISDFSWDKKVVAARERVFDTEKQLEIQDRLIEIKQKRGVAQSEQITTIIKHTLEQLTNTKLSQEDILKTTKELTALFVAAEKGELMDVIANNDFARLATLTKFFQSKEKGG